MNDRRRLILLGLMAIAIVISFLARVLNHDLLARLAGACFLFLIPVLVYLELYFDTPEESRPFGKQKK